MIYYLLFIPALVIGLALGVVLASSYEVTAVVAPQPTVQPVGTDYLQGQVLGTNYLLQ